MGVWHVEKLGCAREKKLRKKQGPEARLVRPAESADLAPRGVDVEGEEALGDLVETEEVGRATQRARDQAEHLIRELQQAHRTRRQQHEEHNNSRAEQRRLYSIAQISFFFFSKLHISSA